MQHAKANPRVKEQKKTGKTIIEPASTSAILFYAQNVPSSMLNATVWSGLFCWEREVLLRFGECACVCKWVCAIRKTISSRHILGLNRTALQLVYFQVSMSLRNGQRSHHTPPISYEWKILRITDDNENNYYLLLCAFIALTVKHTYFVIVLHFMVCLWLPFCAWCSKITKWKKSGSRDGYNP